MWSQKSVIEEMGMVRFLFRNRNEVGLRKAGIQSAFMELPWEELEESLSTHNCAPDQGGQTCLLCQLWSIGGSCLSAVLRRILKLRLCSFVTLRFVTR